MEYLLAVLPLSLSSGINLYLTVFSLGIIDRMGWSTLPAGLDVVGSIPVLIVSGVLLFVEFFADKIPYVDNIWDFLHTVVRPAGALALTLGMIPADTPETRTALMLIAGTTALTAHSSKASFRALVNTSPEPVSNAVVSVAEDVFVVGIVALFAAFPLVATLISVVVLIGLVMALYLIFRWARRVFGSIWGFLRRKTTPHLRATHR